MQQAMSKIKIIHEQMISINEVSKQQDESINQIKQALDQVSEVITDNSAMAQESAAASEQLSAMAQNLTDMIKEYYKKMISQTTSPAGGLLLVLLSQCHFPESPSNYVPLDRFFVYITYRFTVISSCPKVSVLPAEFSIFALCLPPAYVCLPQLCRGSYSVSLNLYISIHTPTRGVTPKITYFHKNADFCLSNTDKSKHHSFSFNIAFAIFCYFFLVRTFLAFCVHL